MAAILYTTSDSIRAAVGVTEAEVADSLLTDQDLETQIKTSMYGWVPTHATIYATGTANGASAAEVYQKDLLVLYCTYFGAVRLVEMIMSLRSRVGDGKSEVERFDVDWMELLGVFEKRRDEARELLEEVLNPTSGGTGYFGLVSPDYDPVTNV